MHRFFQWLFLASILTCASCGTESETAPETVTIYPEEYPHALRNPLKGFRPELWAKVKDNRYMTLVRDYIKWSDVEKNADDDLVANIRVLSQKRWKQHLGTGVRVIPRVYLDWDQQDGNEYWPEDLKAGDYSSPEFKRRVVRLVQALGECWNDDPRVAWVQMGIIGFWGEHHNPHPDAAMQALLGEVFSKAFPDKAVLIRHPEEFTDFDFGIYWDSWAHVRQTPQLKHGAGIERLNQLTGCWKIRPIEGEVAYNWGDWRIQPGDDPNDTLSDPVHREFLIDTIRNLHATALGWVSDYDPALPGVAEGADAVQQAFGYRFVLKEFAFNPVVALGDDLKIQFKVKNTGSAPFYRDWKPALSLLHSESRQVVWSHSMEHVDIRTWLPGDDWDEETNTYQIPAQSYTAEATIALPSSTDLPAGNYIIALSIPDPELNELGLRFAIKNYLKGGFHPLGKLAYGVEATGSYRVDEKLFDDPMPKGL